MYRNEIKEEYDQDWTDDELEEIYADLEKIEPKIKEQLSEHFAQQISLSIALWFKYFRKENTNYKRIASSTFDYPKFTDEETEKYFKRSKDILRDRYSIEVISEDPIVLSSELPFEDIKV